MVLLAIKKMIKKKMNKGKELELKRKKDGSFLVKKKEVRTRSKNYYNVKEQEQEQKKMNDIESRKEEKRKLVEKKYLLRLNATIKKVKEYLGDEFFLPSKKVEFLVKTIGAGELVDLSRVNKRRFFRGKKEKEVKEEEKRWSNEVVLFRREGRMKQKKERTKDYKDRVVLPSREGYTTRKKKRTNDQNKKVLLSSREGNTKHNLEGKNSLIKVKKESNNNEKRIPLFFKNEISRKEVIPLDNKNGLIRQIRTKKHGKKYKAVFVSEERSIQGKNINSVKKKTSGIVKKQGNKTWNVKPVGASILMDVINRKSNVVKAQSSKASGENRQKFVKKERMVIKQLSTKKSNLTNKEVRKSEVKVVLEKKDARPVFNTKEIKVQRIGLQPSDFHRKDVRNTDGGLKVVSLRDEKNRIENLPFSTQKSNGILKGLKKKEAEVAFHRKDSCVFRKEKSKEDNNSILNSDNKKVIGSVLPSKTSGLVNLCKKEKEVVVNKLEEKKKNGFNTEVVKSDDVQLSKEKLKFVSLLSMKNKKKKPDFSSFGFTKEIKIEKKESSPKVVQKSKESVNVAVRPGSDKKYRETNTILKNTVENSTVVPCSIKKEEVINEKQKKRESSVEEAGVMKNSNNLKKSILGLGKDREVEVKEKKKEKRRKKTKFCLERERKR